MKIVVLALMLAMVLVTLGCVDGDSGSSGVPGFDVSGDWEVFISSYQDPDEFSLIIARFVMEPYGRVAGECLTINEAPCADEQFFNGTMQGIKLRGRWLYNERECAIDWLITFGAIEGTGSYTSPFEQPGEIECFPDHGTLTMSRRG